MASRFSIANIQKKFGKYLFNGATAAPYLEKQGLPTNILESVTWSKNKATTDQVAAAILEWAQDHNASVYCHTFQPIGSDGVRHGHTAELQNGMFKINKEGELNWSFSGSDLLQGETDGSSYSTGGLRSTHTAGAYVRLNTLSSVYLRGDTVHIPAVFFSHDNKALDEKIPLIRSLQALSTHGTKLLKLLGHTTAGVESRIGLEQEFFFVPKAAYDRRVDLQLTGRTLLGKHSPRGQEMCDHYMGTPVENGVALACLKDVQSYCYELGIPIKTRHLEVAPGQYEFAPLFGTACVQIDQNLLFMQVLREVAVQHGLVALMHEKPFNGVNGSGKHNNWSIGTKEGINLFNPADTKDLSPVIFPMMIAGMMRAMDCYGDLMRMSIATPGNDFRLGACEAPPCIMSMYLGDALTSFLEAYKNGNTHTSMVPPTVVSLGLESSPDIAIPREDRNRTSPFPYGRNRFEYRAVGASQNVSMVNTVLCTVAANVFKEFSQEIESGKSPEDIVRKTLSDHWRVIFNGNSYELSNQDMLTKRGLWNIGSSVDALQKLTEKKNVKLMEDMGVLTSDECESRVNVSLLHYINTVEMEANCLIDIIRQQIIPALQKNNIVNAVPIESAVRELYRKVHSIAEVQSLPEKAALSRTLRLETMIACRALCDEAEALCPSKDWPIATYTELLFTTQAVSPKRVD